MLDFGVVHFDTKYQLLSLLWFEDGCRPISIYYKLMSHPWYRSPVLLTVRPFSMSTSLAIYHDSQRCSPWCLFNVSSTQHRSFCSLSCKKGSVITWLHHSLNISIQGTDLSNHLGEAYIVFTAKQKVWGQTIHYRKTAGITTWSVLRI